MPGSSFGRITNREKAGLFKNEVDRICPWISGHDSLREFEVHVMDYPTSVGPKNRSIRQIGELLGTRLTERFSDYKEVYLIGHSMGGLVICSMVIEQLKAGRAQELKRIKHVVLFGTPNNGKQISKVFQFFDIQLNELSSDGKTVNEIRREWINRVYDPRIKAGQVPGYVPGHLD